MLTILDKEVIKCNCGCNFTYEKKDLKPLLLHPGYFYLMCPKCNNQLIFITEEKPAKQNIILQNEEK